MIKRHLWSLLILLLLAFLTDLPVKAEITIEETYSIHIIKYRLKSESDMSLVLPMDGTKREGLTDSNGNELKTMSDVQYEVSRLELKEGSYDPIELSSYDLATGSNAFSMTVMTNTSGEATINGLPEGVYQVTELPNEQITKVMDPLIVMLPLTTAQGVLSDVYIYPKSSVVEQSVTKQPSTVIKVPQTSGTIGTNHRIILLLVLTVVMGVVGIMRFKKKSI